MVRDTTFNIGLRLAIYTALAMLSLGCWYILYQIGLFVWRLL